VIQMLKFFSSNIDQRGRWIRLVMALALIAAGALLCVPWWARIMILVAGGFGLFEAARGWCFLRACGIKTKF